MLSTLTAPHGQRTVTVLTLALVTFAPCGLANDGKEVLARWRGGELTRETFLAHHDPQGELLGRGDKRLGDALYKAIYLEIYHRQALAAGLERDPEILADLESRERRWLADLYLRRHQPKAAGQLSDEAVRAAYERQRERFTTAGDADFNAFFVRCGSEDRERRECHARMEALQRRAKEDDADLDALLAEERERSGPANGTFEEVPLDRLADELRAIVTATPPGSFSPVVETPIGLFWVRVVRRQDPVALPFERVERRLRRELTGELAASWREEESERLRQRLGEAVPAGADEEALFAAAARAESLDQDPDFVTRKRSFQRWRLADRAFYRDAVLLPTDEEIERQLRRDDTAERLRRHRVILARLEAVDDRYAALALADEMARGLAGAADKGAYLRLLAKRRSEVSIRELGPLTLGELQRNRPLLRELVEDLEPGGWRGPLALPDSDASPRSEPASRLAFVLLEATRPATVDEARRPLHEDFRARLISSREFYRANLGRRWQLEILIPLEPPPTSEEDGGSP